MWGEYKDSCDVLGRFCTPAGQARVGFTLTRFQNIAVYDLGYITYWLLLCVGHFCPLYIKTVLSPFRASVSTL